MRKIEYTALYDAIHAKQRQGKKDQDIINDTCIQSGKHTTDRT